MDGLRPLHSAQGYILRMLTLSEIEAAGGNVRVVRNKRGHVTRAYLKPQFSLDNRPTSRIGLAFEQVLDSGHVWALHGAIGS